MSETSFVKVYCIWHTLEEERHLLYTKTKCFSVPYDQLDENLIIVFCFCEKKRRYKNEFLTRYIGITAKSFYVKIYLKLLTYLLHH